MEYCVIRDPNGKPVLAEKVREVRLGEKAIMFYVCRVRVRQPSTPEGEFTFSITEPLTGARIGNSVDMGLAIAEATHKLATHTHEAFEGGIQIVLDKFGPLPTVEEMQAQQKG